MGRGLWARSSWMSVMAVGSGTGRHVVLVGRGPWAVGHELWGHGWRVRGVRGASMGAEGPEQWAVGRDGTCRNEDGCASRVV